MRWELGGGAANERETPRKASRVVRGWCVFGSGMARGHVWTPVCRVIGSVAPLPTSLLSPIPACLGMALRAFSGKGVCPATGAGGGESRGRESNTIR